jgi:hypothetical protein
MADASMPAACRPWRPVARAGMMPA